MMSTIVNYLQGPLIPDIASHVFSFLDTQGKQNVALVCRLWRDVVYLPVHWKNVTVELPPTCSEMLLQSLVKRRITRISCPRSSFEDICVVFGLLPDVSYLNVGGCPRITELQLKREFARLEKLKHLVFKRCTRISDTFLEASAPKLKNLKSLVLEDCENITEFGLRTFLKHVHGLERLDLTWCENMRDVCLQDIAVNCPELKSLVLRGCDWLSADAMHHLINHLPKLVHLDFRWSHGLTDNGVKILAEGLPNLKYLDVKECPLVTSKGIKYVAKNLHELSYLAFGGSDNLNLQFSSNDEEVEVMFLEIASMAKLQTLHFDVEGVSDICIRTVLKQLPNLVSLDMGFVDNLTDTTAKIVGQFLPNLLFLSLSSPFVQDFGIISIAQNLKKLVSLDLRNCPLTNKGLQEIAPFLTSLKSLVLSSHQNVTNIGVKCLAENAKSLTSLDLMDCDYVTNAGASLIAMKMTNLQQLNLSFCHKISNKGKK